MRPAWVLALVFAACARAGAPILGLPAYENPGAGQVFYFVLTDRFQNGDPGNDRGGLTGGRDQTGFDPANKGYYHGGDLRGLTERLDYIQHLGASAIWITPPFRNQMVQDGSAGYHGYWILDFLHVDPHLGTDADLHAFIAAAHTRGLRVYLDIVANHTADVIHYRDGGTRYIDLAHSPYRDASGRPFDEHALAYNGLGPADFPPLSVLRSFPHVPVVRADQANAKNPAWLNDLTLYHNRGNSHFEGENSLYGDFVGLDDLFTEHPRVVQGFIALYRHWMEAYGVDGFRIDTVKHVNQEFWQAFAPAIHARAREIGRPDFFMFGEVTHDRIDGEFSSAFANTGTLDAVLDFGFFGGVRAYVSEQKGPGVLRDLFAADSYFTGPDRTAGSLTTFISNHDAGRFGYFLEQNNPLASRSELLRLEELADGLLFFSRGQPVMYYGDEQGMTGFGNDMAAREDMFASQTPEYRALPLLGTTRTGADDKFDESNPLYRWSARLARLRLDHPGLSSGATIVRSAAGPDIFAFSRIERGELIEYLAAFNASRTQAHEIRLQTAQPPGAHLSPLCATFPAPSLTADAAGTVLAKLPPLACVVWQAAERLPPPSQGPTVTMLSPAPGATLHFTERTVDGQPIPSRIEVRADVAGGDGVAEVTFLLARASRPGQYEVLGTANAPPYRVYWHPPADWPRGEIATFLATADDLRGHRASAEAGNVAVAPNDIAFGIRGAQVPRFTALPAAAWSPALGSALHWQAPAAGTPPIFYQWYLNGVPIPGATRASFDIGRATPDDNGRYVVTASDREGTIASPEITVQVDARPRATVGRLDSFRGFASRWVPPREVDVWVPPGYDQNAGRRYPVIYMEDGQNAFDGRFSYTGVPWAIDRSIDRLMRQGATHGAIVVAIWNTGLGRVPEYMPQPAATAPWADQLAFPFALPHLALRSDAYLRFVVSELKPWVDAHYRTNPSPAGTFTLGSSMGALISAYAMERYPQVFGGAACLSTHWPIDHGSAVAYFAAHLPPVTGHRWYFDHGTRTLDADYGPYQERMDAALRAAGYANSNWNSRVYSGDDHSETSWSRRLDQPLRFLLSASSP